MLNEKPYWRAVHGGQLPNLFVLTHNGADLGFIYRPANTRTDKNTWRLHTGIGEATNFLGHEYNKNIAKKQVEKQLGLTT